MKAPTPVYLFRLRSRGSTTDALIELSRDRRAETGDPVQRMLTNEYISFKGAVYRYVGCLPFKGEGKYRNRMAQTFQRIREPHDVDDIFVDAPTY